MRRLVLLVLVLTACASTPVEQRSWIEVRSPNFTIYTNLPEAKAIALSEEVEVFRAVVRKLTNAKRFDPRVPTRIFAFAKAGEFQLFSPSRGLGGYFRAGLRENIVALDASGTRGMDARTIFFHEYTHFLVHNQAALALPLWYDEGFAELLATTRIDKSTVFIGAAPTYRRANALWTDAHAMESILTAREFERWDAERTSMFYLQAWQLVHYFMLGPGKDQGVGRKLANYMQRVAEGHEDEVAFESAFGMDFDALARELKRYNEQRSIPALNVPRSAFAPDQGHEVRAMPPAEIAVQLGYLALSVGRFDLAEGYFNRATALEPNRARAYAGLGVVEQFARNGELARPDFERALELAPDDYETHLEIAEWIHQTAETEQRPSMLAEAREHYRRAIELAPDVPEGHAMLGRTYLMTGEDPLPGIASLEHARKLLPGEITLLLPLAQLYERAGRHEDARITARRVERWSHGELSDDARELLAEIDSKDAAKAEAQVEPQAAEAAPD